MTTHTMPTGPTWSGHMSPSSSCSSSGLYPDYPDRMGRRQHPQARAVIAAKATGVTARGRPPPTHHARFVAQVMYALFALSFLHVFGLDLLRIVWAALTG